MHISLGYLGVKAMSTDTRVKVRPWDFPAKREIVTIKALQLVKAVVMCTSADWENHDSAILTTRGAQNVDKGKRELHVYWADQPYSRNTVS